MVVFPLVAMAISGLFSAVVLRQYFERRRTYQLVWGIALAMFAVGAGSEVVGSIWGWTPTLARLYYLTGATLVVGYLGLGTMFLMAPPAVARFAAQLIGVLTLIALGIVAGSPVDAAALADEGWRALQKPPELTGITLFCNIVGTIVLVGGALWSGWQLWRRGAPSVRAAANGLIALGALSVASGGTLTRFGHHEYLYIAMSIGVTIMFAGVLLAGRKTWPAWLGSFRQQPLASDHR